LSQTVPGTGGPDAADDARDLASDVIVPGDLAASILESVTDAFFALDREWRFTYANHTAEALLARTREELLGNVVWELFPEAVGSDFDRHYRAAIETGQPQAFEAYYEPLETWFEVRAFPAREGLAVYFADINERRAAEQERDDLLAHLYAAIEVTDITLSTLDVDTLLPALLSRLVRVMDADAAAVLLTESDGLLHVRGTIGLEGLEYDQVALAPGEGFVGTIAEQRMPACLEDVSLEPDRVSPQLAASGMRTVVGAPLLSDDQLVGIIHVDWREIHQCDEAEDAVLRLAADRLALGIRNARLYEEVREAERFSAALNRLNTILHATLDVNEIQRRAVAEVTAAMRCDSAALDIYRDGWWVPVHVHNLPAEMVGRKFSAAEVPFVEAAVESGEPVAVDDALNDPRSSREVQEQYGIPSVLVAPLVRRGAVFGALFFNYHTPHRFTDAEVDFARKLGAAVSLALDNAELYEIEHRVARTLQEALLALPERVEGVELAHAYRSATAQTLVGGDFYDLFEVGDRLAVVTGDISGKGIHAAVLTSLVRHTLQAFAEEPGRSPARIVGRTNNVLERESQTETFATIFLGMVERATGRLTYCNAGHTTCAVLGQNGEVRQLPANSSLVGAFRDVEFCDSDERLAPGETLFLYTDGLIDANGEVGRFGEARLFESLRVHAGDEPGALVDSVLAEVTAFSRGDLADDVCVLALRWLGAAVYT